MQSAITQELHGAASLTSMYISADGDIAVVTGDTLRYLNWHLSSMARYLWRYTGRLPRS